MLGILVMVFCAGLRINPFREKTTSFLIAAFSGLIGLALILVLLNVATNISLIADAKTTQPGRPSSTAELVPWVTVLLGTAGAIVCMIFAGTNYSKKKLLQLVRSQADEMLKENEQLLCEISSLLAQGQAADYRRVWQIREFLNNQRKDLPDLTIVYSGHFGEKTAYYQIGRYFHGEEGEPTYKPEYFPCSPNHDCDYLKEFFSGSKVEVLQKHTTDEGYCIYFPVIGKESRFILLFAHK
ncbi:MAG: hypothetical protein HY986_01470, partial [Candidatus Melainabacteria bacterium]|nr:hypothetical protein [Candidatus Melainabacteria bacterium]